MSESTSAIVISTRSSWRCLRTTRPVSRPSESVCSSSTVGGVIQFSGLTFGPPPSAQTMNVPSAFSISNRTASGRAVVRRPM